MCDICVDLTNNYHGIKGKDGLNATSQTALFSTQNSTTLGGINNPFVFNIFNGQNLSSVGGVIQTTYPLTISTLIPLTQMSMLYNQIVGLTLTGSSQKYIQLPAGEYRIRYTLPIGFTNYVTIQNTFNVYNNSDVLLGAFTINIINSLTTTLDIVDDSSNVLTTVPSNYQNTSTLLKNEIEAFNNATRSLNNYYFDFYINLQRTTNIAVRFRVNNITNIAGSASFPSQPIYGQWLSDNGNDIYIEKLNY